MQTQSDLASTAGPRRHEAASVSLMCTVSFGSFSSLPCRSRSIGRTTRCFLKSSLVLGRELRSVDRDGQLVKLARELERYLIVLVVDRRAGIGANVEGLVPLQNERQRTLHSLVGHDLAVNLEHAGAGPADATHVVERERGEAQAIVLEVELKPMLARRERLCAFPALPLQVDQVPDEDRLALQQVEPPAREPTTLGRKDALGAALANSTPIATSRVR